MNDSKLDKGNEGSNHSYMRTNDVTPSISSRDSCLVPCFKPELVNRLREGLPSDGRLEEAQLLFSALGDRTRLKVLLSLRGGEELCVCDVAHVLGVTISSASHHLRKMRDLKILRSRNDGKMSYYALRDGTVASLLEQVFPVAEVLELRDARGCP